MTAATAFARGLGVDQASWEMGREHARHGIPWSPPEVCDLLSYSLGHAAGAAELACCYGDRAQPEPERRQ